MRRIQPFEALSNSMRLALDVEIAEPAVVHALAALVAGARGGRGELRLLARIGEERVERVVLGRDFLLDADLAEAVEHLPGVLSVRLSSAEPKLALVS